MRFNKLILIFICFVFSSCIDDEFNLNNLDTSELKSEFRLPFINGDIKLIDIVENIDSSLVVDDSTKILKVLFENDDSFSFSSDNIISLDQLEYTGSQKLYTKKIKLDELSKLKKVITLDELSDNMTSLSFVKLIPDSTLTIFPELQSNESGGNYPFNSFDKFKYVSVDSGFVNFEIKNNLSVPVSIDFAIKNVDGTFLQISAENILQGETYSVNKDLKNKIIKNKLDIEIIKFTTPGSGLTPVVINPSTDNIDVNFNIGEIIVDEGEININEVGDLIDTNFDVDLIFYDDVELENIIFKRGNLELKISSSLNYDVNIDYTLPALNENQVLISDVANLISNQEYIGSYNIKNFDFDLYNEFKEKYNSLRINTKLNILSSTDYFIYKSGEEIDVFFTFSNIEFKEINGYFGEKQYSIDESEIELDKDLFDFYDKISGDFILTNPNFGFNIFNSIGIPLFLDIKISAYDNYNNSESIEFSSKIDKAPSKENSFSSTNIFLNKDNSNIVNFINLPPSNKINVEGNFQVNPDGKSYDNFVLDNSKINANLFVEIPFQLSAYRMRISDTLKITEKINFDYDLNYAKVIFDYESDIPVSFNINLFYYDSEFNEIDRNFGNILINESETNEDGYSVNSINDSFEIELDDKVLNRLNDLENIIFEIELNTENNNSVNITSDNKFKFNSTLEVKLNGI